MARMGDRDEVEIKQRLAQEPRRCLIRDQGQIGPPTDDGVGRAGEHRLQHAHAGLRRHFAEVSQRGHEIARRGDDIGGQRDLDFPAARQRRGVALNPARLVEETARTPKQRLAGGGQPRLAPRALEDRHR